MPRAAPLSPRVATVAEHFRAGVESGRLDLPLPGRGRTLERWRALVELAAEDLCVARLCEAHLDALAILTELEGPPAPPRSRWGVWAAHPPSPSLVARRDGEGWRLEGTKPWCSGARVCTHALVTADGPDGYRLFAVDLTEVRPVPGTWHAVGMAGSDSLDVEFAGVPAQAVGAPGAYLERSGFWHGAMAVAAVWHGGAVGVARALLDTAGRRPLGPHALAHLGAVDAALSAVTAALEIAAGQVDADPEDASGAARLTAARLRVQVERTAAEVLERVGRALGAGPMCRDARHATLTADLPVYLRQSHAETDLADLGGLVLERGLHW